MSNIYREKADGFFCIEKSNGIYDFGANLPMSVKIVLLYEGKTKVWVDSKSAEIANAKDAIIVFPDQKYRFETIEPEKYIFITADIKRLGELLGVLSSNIPASGVIKGAMNDIELSELAKSTLKAYTMEQSEYRGTVIKGYVIALLGKMLSMTELCKVEIERDDTLSEIVRYCNLHFREKLSLEILENDLHISKFYISHVINEKLGEGFNEYVNAIRINEACRLLLESDKSIKEISTEVGFGTVRSFDRVFLQKKGETAREYRKRNFENLKKE